MRSDERGGWAIKGPSGRIYSRTLNRFPQWSLHKLPEADRDAIRELVPGDGYCVALSLLPDGEGEQAAELAGYRLVPVRLVEIEEQEQGQEDE
jgi:hypothetical protein